MQRKSKHAEGGQSFIQSAMNAGIEPAKNRISPTEILAHTKTLSVVSIVANLGLAKTRKEYEEISRYLEKYTPPQNNVRKPAQTQPPTPAIPRGPKT